MPPRFRRTETMANFELVPDDEREDPPSPVPAEQDGARRRGPAGLRDRVLARWRVLSRRGRAAVAAGAAVVLVVAAVAAVAPGLLDARAERLRAAAVQEVPGGVADLSEPLSEVWSLTTDGAGLAVLRGGLVLATEGTAVAAVDAGTGREAWRHEIGTFPTCSPTRGYQGVPEPPADVVVCLSGPSKDRTVTVLDAAGAVVGERSFGAARSGAYDDAAPDGAPVVVPAADGALAVVEDVTDATAPWPADDAPDEDTLRELRADGWRDPRLRLEDALTGEVRGVATVRLRPEDLGACGLVQDEGSPAELMTEPVVVASSSMTVLSVCGAVVLLTPDGTEVDRDVDGAWPQLLPGGGLVLIGEESTVLDAAGSVVATVPGYVVPPVVDSDPGSFFLTLADLEDTGQGLRLVAVGQDGAERWANPIDDLRGVLARVAGVVVVEAESGLAGLDAATGAEVWAREDVLRRADGGPGEWVAGVVTDGTRLLLGVSGENPGHRLVALDLRDGTTAWAREQGGYLESLSSAGGHVVAAVDRATHGLG